MKAIRIVCRIDDLGRVIIPKEIRHSMNIKEGVPTALSFSFYVLLHHTKV